MEKIRKLLDSVEVLPLSPALLPKLLPKLSDVDTNFDEVVEIIAFDPALTAKLLQICNSAFFGHESEVTTVAEAVNRVGYQAVYLLVAMINGSNCFPCPSPAGVDAGKLWQHSITTAFNTKFVAESAGLDGNQLFTAGLLHDIGKVILGQAQAQAAAGLFRNAVRCRFLGKRDCGLWQHASRNRGGAAGTLETAGAIVGRRALSPRSQIRPGFCAHRRLRRARQFRQPQPGTSASH